MMLCTPPQTRLALRLGLEHNLHTHMVILMPFLAAPPTGRLLAGRLWQLRSLICASSVALRWSVTAAHHLPFLKSSLTATQIVLSRMHILRFFCRFLPHIGWAGWLRRRASALRPRTQLGRQHQPGQRAAVTMANKTEMGHRTLMGRPVHPGRYPRNRAHGRSRARLLWRPCR